jgi:L-threonylcarbamoyladenylate synthase
MLREVIGEVHVAEVTVGLEDSAISPGLQGRHYAPRTAAYRFAREVWPGIMRWAQERGPVALLSHDEAMMLPAPHETIRMPAEAADYARVLYAALRQADERRVWAIVVLEPEETAGLWAAVRDRLRRATEEWAAA